MESSRIFPSLQNLPNPFIAFALLGSLSIEASGTFAKRDPPIYETIAPFFLDVGRSRYSPNRAISIMGVFILLFCILFLVTVSLFFSRDCTTHSQGIARLASSTALHLDWGCFYPREEKETLSVRRLGSPFPTLRSLRSQRGDTPLGGGYKSINFLL